MAHGNASTVDAGLDIAEQSKLDGHLYRHSTQPASKCQSPPRCGGTYFYALTWSTARPGPLGTSRAEQPIQRTLHPWPTSTTHGDKHKSIGQIGDSNARKK